jgi:stage II sporulation protein D
LLPDGPLSHPAGRIIRVVRRFGPARSLAALLGTLTLALVGCFTLAERSPWRRVPGSDLPPEIEVGRVVRVRLLGSRDAPPKIEVTCPFQITDSVDNRILRSPTVGLRVCTVSPTADGGLDLGDTHLTQGDVLLTPRRDASIVVNGKTYRGLLRIRRTSDGVSLTNHVDVESYLLGVLRGELPRNFHPESFKAQCVAARTYVLYQMRLTPPERTFDVYDNEGSQMYIGVTGEGPKTVRAVDETRGQICVWNDHGIDRIFCTYYSSACGGLSQHVNNIKPNDPNVPPLAGNIVCNDCYLARFYRWPPLRISKSELTKRIVARYPSIARLGTIVGLKPKELTSDGRIIRIHLDGSTGQNETLIGEDFRLCVGGRILKSTNFAIEAQPDYFVFGNGKGFGHGVGLCQNGMETKARRGMSYDRILSFYYPASKLKTLYR